MKQSQTKTKTSPRPVLTYSDIAIARTVLKAAMRDYQRPDVQADFKRWKEDRAAKAR